MQDPFWAEGGRLIHLIHVQAQHVRAWLGNVTGRHTASAELAQFRAHVLELSAALTAYMVLVQSLAVPQSGSVQQELRSLSEHPLLKLGR